MLSATRGRPVGPVQNTPNFSFTPPELPYGGPRDADTDLFCGYAQCIAEPVQLHMKAMQSARSGGHFGVETPGGRCMAANVILANGAFRRPGIPAASAGLPGHVYQLLSHDYLNPPAARRWRGVLVVLACPSGGQITDDLPAAAVRFISPSPRARRHPAETAAGRLLLNPAGHPAWLRVRHQRIPGGAPLPAASAIRSGHDCGHSVHLLELGSRGTRLHGRFEGTSDGVLAPSDDLPDG